VHVCVTLSVCMCACTCLGIVHTCACTAWIALLSSICSSLKAQTMCTFAHADSALEIAKGFDVDVDEIDVD